MSETGWIDDIFHDFMKDSTYHLKDNLPYLSEVIAEESEQLCHNEKKELIEEFQTDLDSLNPDILYSYMPLRKLNEKWEERSKQK